MAGLKKCVKCKKVLDLEQFPFKLGMPTHTATCAPCTGKKRAHRAANKSAVKARDPDSDCNSDKEAAVSTGHDLPPLPLGEFLTFLSRQKDAIKVKANVTLGELSEYLDRREHADALVNLMWDVMSYRFLCVACSWPITKVPTHDTSFHWLDITVNIITNDQ